MTVQIAAYGRLAADPRPIQTRSGTAMTTARIAANIPDRTQGADDGAEATLWLGVVAFGRVAEDLARQTKGEPVSVAGRRTRGRARWPARRGSRPFWPGTGEHVAASGLRR